MTRPAPIAPAVGQESVWDYPRPPRLEPVPERLPVALAGVTVADTMAGWRVLETSHPPTYCFPPAAILPGSLAGGWITARIVGPCKGGPGTRGR